MPMARGIKAIHRRLIRHTRVPIEERIKRRAAANRQITDEWKKMVGLPTQKRFTVREAAKATGLTKPTLEAFAWRGELRISGGEKENQPRVFFSQAAIRKIARKEGLRFRSQRKRFSRAQAMQALDVSATQFKRLTKRHQIKPVETSLQRIPAKSLRRFVVQKMVWIPTRIAYEEFQRRVRHVYSLSFNQFKRVIKEQGLTEKQKGTLKNQVNFFAFNRFLDWVVNTMEQGYTVQKLARAIGMKPGSVNIGLVSDPALLKQIVYFGWGGRIWIPKKLAEQIIQNHQ
ncbi:hypothetical protein KKE06_04480, partial [Candidatus Micrarchaeota archaeon]|nr:hypothetical protein [Candidatus Micrarchaeota archaeon]MBU1930269.1 hypothetical protein [Candidatus Micrarchaeota archaeon]